jgi:NAD(P)-dependent dehydrogenase (short-subunit alcohol dehydrogenase family)
MSRDQTLSSRPLRSAGANAVAVLGGDSAFGAALTAGLARAGHQVVAVDDLGLDHGDVVRAAIERAAPDGVTAVVDAGYLREPPSPGELAALPPAEWLRIAEQPMRRALHVLQAAHRCLPGGGRVVVLLPSLVMSGAAGVVAWSAAAEGYRSLAKAAARAWGPDGVTLTCVLVPASLIADGAVDRPGLQPPALGRAPDVMSDIAPVISGLLDERFASVTGLTLAVDGGVWMTS